MRKREIVGTHTTHNQTELYIANGISYHRIVAYDFQPVRYSRCASRAPAGLVTVNISVLILECGREPPVQGRRGLEGCGTNQGSGVEPPVGPNARVVSSSGISAGKAVGWSAVSLFLSR